MTLPLILFWMAGTLALSAYKDLRDHVKGSHKSFGCVTRLLRTIFQIAVASTVFCTTSMTLEQIHPPILIWFPEPAATVRSLLAPFHIASSYGLFRRMTGVGPIGKFADVQGEYSVVQRPELIVQGSMDGKKWRSYGVRYKPGDPKDAPSYIMPHQPRVAWQFWFAALVVSRSLVQNFRPKFKCVRLQNGVSAARRIVVFRHVSSRQPFIFYRVTINVTHG